MQRHVKTWIFHSPAYIITNGTEEEHAAIREEMLTIIDVRKKPTLDPELSRHRPLRHGHSVKADDTRISEETRRTRCAQVYVQIGEHRSCQLMNNLFSNFCTDSIFCIRSLAEMALGATIKSQL